MKINQSPFPVFTGTGFKAYRLSFLFFLILLIFFASESLVSLLIGYGWLKGEVLKTCLLLLNSFKRVFLDLIILRIIPLLVILLLIGSFLYSAIRAVYSIYRTRVILRTFNKYTEIGKDLSEVNTMYIKVVDDLRPFAFTIGYIHPVIVVSESLLKRLKEQERRALLLHEELHRRRRDPLRQLVVNFIADALWYIPWISRLKDIFKISKEIAADEEVLAQSNQPLDLAGAILKIVKEQTTPTRDLRILSFFSISAIEMRLERIINGRKGFPCANPLRNLLLTLMAGVFLLAVITPLFVIYLVNEGILPYTGFLIGVKCI